MSSKATKQRGSIVFENASFDYEDAEINLYFEQDLKALNQEYYQQKLQEAKIDPLKMVAPALFNISHEFKPFKLTAIVGQVSSGKSSLIKAILHDLRLVEGKFGANGSIAYLG